MDNNEDLVYIIELSMMNPERVVSVCIESLRIVEGGKFVAGETLFHRRERLLARGGEFV